MIEIKRFVFSPFYENTYILWDNETHEGAIIDPGCFTPKEQKELNSFIQNSHLKIKYLLNTHCHLDHVFGNNFVIDEYQPEYFIPEGDLFLLQRVQEMAKHFGLEMQAVYPTEKFLSENTVLTFGGSEIHFLFTPGHTPGEFCIYVPASAFCITGDVLFQNSIGRTDLPGGNYELLIESIKNKLLVLPGTTVIYPGHGELSTIGTELKFNPFLGQ